MKLEFQGDLLDSPHSSENQQDIKKYENIRNDLSVKLDSLSQQLLYFIQTQDPKDRKANIQSRLIKQNKRLKQQNIKLIQQNKYLQNQLNQLKKLLQKQKQNIENSQQELNKGKLEFSQLQKTIQLSQGPIHYRLDKLGCSQQKSSMQISQQMLKHARQLKSEDKYNIQAMNTFLFVFVDKLKRKLDLAEINNSFNGKQDQNNYNNILVNKYVYARLLQFYCDATLIIKKPTFISSQTQIKLINQSSIFQTNTVLENHKDLQFFFQNLAKKYGFIDQWQLYLKQNQVQSKRFKHQLSQIVRNQFQSNRHKKNVSYKRDDQFFEKLDKVVKYLDFDSQQKIFWEILNDKRRTNKILSLDQLLQKINKNSCRLSDFFSTYFLKTINQMFICVYNILQRKQIKKDNNPEQQLNPQISKTLSRIQKDVKDNLSKMIQLNLNELISNQDISYNDLKHKNNLQNCVYKVIVDYTKVLADNFYMYHEPVKFSFY